MNTESISKIKDIVSLNMREDGWTPMATIGLKLIASGIDIKDYGFTRLKLFFESLSEHFVIGVDEKSQLPLVKCNGKETQNSVSSFKKNTNSNKNEIIHSFYNSGF